MIELLRRLILLAGACAAAWLWWDSPVTLISVRRPDFAMEYARKYGERKYAFMGAIEHGRELIRKTTDPGGIAEFRKRTLSSRFIDPPARDLAPWVDSIDAALKGQGPAAPRTAKEQVFFLPEEPPIDLFLPGIKKIYGGASWLNSYSTVAGRDLEFRYHPEPRDSAAPAWLLYPQRGQAWIWLLAALAVYFLLPRAARRSSVRHDPIPITALDLAGATIAAFFFALPLFVHDSNTDAVDDIFGGAGISWLVSAFVALLMMSNARRAAFGITVADTGLRLSRLTGNRDIAFGEIASVTPIDDGAERLGLQLRLTSGETIDLKWAGLMNFASLLDILWRTGYYRPGVMR
ncbi:MAG: hypothetical protein IH602_00160 [Bryobacteraceae bacterium]|nr:hypothetical protein [Bryobacteraceae bacterium]